MANDCKRHYHVVENTPGYLPDSDEPCIFLRKDEAWMHAASLARDLRDDGYKVSGTRETGYYAERDSSDLGRVIEIHECTDSACAEDVAELTS